MPDAPHPACGGCDLQAALEAVWAVPCGGVIYGDSNTVFIANDWHTALLPVYLQVSGGGRVPGAVWAGLRGAVAAE
jgi:hypothetical protein